MAIGQLQLHNVLLEVTVNLYFQPPENTKIQYPCIIYSRDYALTEFANNSPYKHHKRYEVTVIDSDPESALLEKVDALPMCIFNRHFTSDDLHHDVYQLYY